MRWKAVDEPNALFAMAQVRGFCVNTRQGRLLWQGGADRDGGQSWRAPVLPFCYVRSARVCSSLLQEQGVTVLFDQLVQILDAAVAVGFEDFAGKCALALADRFDQVGVLQRRLLGALAHG